MDEITLDVQNDAPAVNAYFEEGQTPGRIRLHFVNDPVPLHA